MLPSAAFPMRNLNSRRPNPWEHGAMGVFLRLLGVVYAAFAMRHLVQIQAAPQLYWQASVPMQLWAGGLLAGDLIAAAGLWFRQGWGVLAFLAIALGQTALALEFPRRTAPNPLLTAFQIGAVLVFAFIAWRAWRKTT